MHILEIIAKKRDHQVLTKAEIEYFIDNYTKGLIPDYQASALLMAIYINGMNDEETINLALSMRDSGDVLDLSDVPGIKVDKHSTGGVGDKVSLVLGPILAYSGLVVAKMSGRGLGHTGGTIDKLEAIPGFRTSLSVDEFKQQLTSIGLAIIGQTGHIAPADKKIYALRDVSETVSNRSLIASSIMSKKLASGADCICLDVKVGSGAFMKNVSEATKLAKLMIRIGQSQGKNIKAILTDMDEPLGLAIGNSLEVIEAIATLKGQGPEDLVHVCAVIGAQLLLASQLEVSFNVAYNKLRQIMDSGVALDKLSQMIKAQGGDPEIISHPQVLLKGVLKEEVFAQSSGYIKKTDALSLGNAAKYLGAGRETIGDKILLDVGIVLNKKVGDQVKQGDSLAVIYHHNKGLLEAKAIVQSAIIVGNKPPKQKLIKKVI
ncbi:MAG: thymidine phosphorylase [Acholeplasmatales bacterium]|jgi:pyrimidine-nucleoside phosphorylase|nr:thymidine phosphorylase [Acholeplasmatales bacterium]